MSRESGQPIAATKTDIALEAGFAHALSRLGVEPPFALAVSGGGDSSALMHLSARWARDQAFDLSTIFVLTVDHGLREGSRGEAEQVGEWARGLGFQHRVLVWTGDKPTSRIQEKAREARYGLLGGWARDKGMADILVAHTADDQAETVAMRLLKGSGTMGLAGMQERVTDPNGIRILRPLLNVEGDELRAWLQAHGLPWLEDPSNSDPSYERVRMRRALAESIHLTGELAQLSADASSAREALEAAVDDLVRDAVHVEPAGWATFNPLMIRSAPAVVAQQALSRMLLAFGGGGYPPSRSALGGLLGNLLVGKFAGATLSGCILASGQEGKVLIGREGRNITGLALTAEQGGVWDHRFQVRVDRAVQVRDLGSLGLDRFAKSDRERIKSAFPPPLRASALVIEGQGEDPAVPHAGVGSCGRVEVVFGGLRPFGPLKLVK